MIESMKLNLIGVLKLILENYSKPRPRKGIMITSSGLPLPHHLKIGTTTQSTSLATNMDILSTTDSSIITNNLSYVATTKRPSQAIV
jgi:hypothetical protein